MTDRYKMNGDYKFDRYIFQGAMWLIFIYIFFVAYHYDFKLNYYVCGAGYGETCINPFYHASTWENVERLGSGEYGTKPGLLYNAIWSIIGVLFVLAFVSNHFIYNKGKKILPDDTVLKHEEDNNN